MQILNNLNLNGNVLENTGFENLAADPVTCLKRGRMYYNTTLNCYKVYNGTAWVFLTGMVVSKTTDEWRNGGLIVSKKDVIYVYTDYYSDTIEGETIYIPGVKIGDGNAYVQDLSFTNQYITQSTIEKWNNKVTAYIDDVNKEKLVLSKD